MKKAPNISQGSVATRLTWLDSRFATKSFTKHPTTFKHISTPPCQVYLFSPTIANCPFAVFLAPSCTWDFIAVQLSYFISSAYIVISCFVTYVLYALVYLVISFQNFLYAHRILPCQQLHRCQLFKIELIRYVMLQSIIMSSAAVDGGYGQACMFVDMVTRNGNGSSWQVRGGGQWTIGYRRPTDRQTDRQTAGMLDTLTTDRPLCLIVRRQRHGRACDVGGLAFVIVCMWRHGSPHHTLHCVRVEMEKRCNIATATLKDSYVYQNQAKAALQNWEPLEQNKVWQASTDATFQHINLLLPSLLR